MLLFLKEKEPKPCEETTGYPVVQQCYAECKQGFPIGSSDIHPPKAIKSQ